MYSHLLSFAGIPIHGQPVLETSAVYADSSSATMTNHLQQETYLLPYRRAAINCLLDHELELPPSDVLSLIVESAVAACQLFFAAAMQHPSAAENRDVFKNFVLSCVSQPVEEVVL